MDNEAFQRYLKDRYEEQRKWLSRRAVVHRRLTFAFQIPVIVMAAVVPVFAALGYTQLTIILSAGVAAGLGIMNFAKSEDLWHNYRITERELTREKALYEHRIGKYASAKEPEKLFVEQVESLLTREFQKWALLVRRESE